MTPGLYRFAVAGKAPYHSVESSPSFRIVAPNDLRNAEVGGLDGLFTEKVGRVSPQLTVELAGAELAEGRDYTVAYHDAVWAEDDYGYERGEKTSAPFGVGSYYAVIEGTGPFTGSYTSYFKVGDARSLDTAKLELGRVVYPYTGKPVALDYKLTAYDGAELTSGKDYRLKYGKWNDLAGPDDEGAIYEMLDGAPVDLADDDDDCYAVYAEGIGAYTGETQCLTFDIVEAGSLDAAVVRFADPQTANERAVAYTGRKAVPAFDLVYPGKNGDIVLVEGVDYTVWYEAETVEEGDDGSSSHRWEEVDSPTAVGQYYAKIVPAGGSEYSGRKGFDFCICKSLDKA